MNLLKKGRLFFSIGALLFFPGIFFVYFLIEYGDGQSDIVMASSVVSAMMVIIGILMLLFSGALLFKNRRIV